MTTVNPSRRISNKTLSTDINAFHGLSTVIGYVTTRPEATDRNLSSAYEAMLDKQKREAELNVMLKAASDATRRAEAEFHAAVLAMKESVRGQFGPDSDEAQAVGYKKKSEYKRPRRRAQAIAHV